MPRRARLSGLPAAALAGVVAIATGGGAATAQGEGDGASVAGQYTATFTSVANNCKDIGMNLSSLVVQVDQPKARRVSVTIPSVPIMNGTVSKAGKFRAAVKRGKTATEGVDGRFSVAGKVEKRSIQFLFVAEYFRDARPLCTQSWNATGPRK